MMRLGKMVSYWLILKFQDSLSKTGKSGGFWGRLLEPLLKTCLNLTKNLFKPPAKNVLIPLELTLATPETDVTIQK